MKDLHKTLHTKGITKWLLGLLILSFATGGSYIVYRQVIVIPSQETRRRAQTVPVERLSLPITVSANGTIKPERSINVSPKTSGRLKSLLVQEGDAVKQGQIIAYMDDSNFMGQLKEAQGQLASAQANLQKLIAGNRPQEISQAQAQLRNAQAALRQTEASYRQDQELAASGAISRRDLENSLAERDKAQAQVAQSQQALALQQVGSRPEDIAQARAQVVTAQGTLQNVQTQIDDTVIRAPFSGIVTRKFSDPGAFVTPTTAGSEVSSATSSSILSLASTNQVVANVAETDIAQLRVGQSATIRADAYPKQTFKGKITQIAVESTVEQNVTSFEVKAAILSDAEQLLRVGMNVDIEFNAGELKNALVVPTVAIVRQENGTGVFVAGKDNKPIFTPIVTGLTVNDKTEIKSGLQGNERVSVNFPEGTRPQTTRGRGIFPGPPPR